MLLKHEIDHVSIYDDDSSDLDNFLSRKVSLLSRVSTAPCSVRTQSHGAVFHCTQFSTAVYWIIYNYNRTLRTVQSFTSV